MARGEDEYTPSRLSSAGPTRSARRDFASSSSISTLGANASPASTRGGRTAPGASFSPYARRSAAAKIGNSTVERKAVAPSPGGLFGAVRSLPGRALGYLFRSASTQSLEANRRDDELADEEESRVESTGAGRGMGLPSAYSPVEVPTRRLGRSKTSANLSSQIVHSPSLSTLSEYTRPPTAQPPPRSAYSTLTLPSSSKKVFSTQSRAVSPALSAASLDPERYRSPSPVRNGLAGSMSTFSLGGEQRYASPATVFAPSTYGLTSKSPFVSRSPSLATLPRSQTTNTLFPYASSIPRGGSPSVEDSGFKRSHAQLSDGGSPAPSSAGTSRGWARRAGSTGGTVPPYNFVPSLHQNNVRQNSPLNPSFGSARSENGAERARKKQLVWNPDKGFVSRDELERERQREVERSLPKNEAERILEVLESMGKGSEAQAKRNSGRVRFFFLLVVPALSTDVLHQPNINVPVVSPAFQSRLTGSVPSNSPYSRKIKSGGEASTPAREGTGLSSVFRAREDRRRAAEDADREEREERERERQEDEEREIERERRRRERRRQREFEQEEEERDAMVVDPPRRKTRSMVKSETSANLSAKAKATPKGKGKAKSRSKRDVEESDEDTIIEEVVKPKSSKKVAKGSPPPPPPVVEVIPQSPPLPATLPPARPTSLAPPSTASSLRPSRSHSSRTHITSSRVFSAREEDLPPVDEGDLGKIKLPPMVFPSTFSFPTASTTASSKSASPAVESTSLVSRMSSTPPTTAALVVPLPKSAPLAIPQSVPLAVSASASADFFSKPVTPIAPIAKVIEVAPTAKIPSFFGAALAVPTPPIVSPAVTPFSFGAQTPVPSPPAEVVKPAESQPNPFASFGAPIAPALAPASSLFGAAPVKPAEVRSRLVCCTHDPCSPIFEKVPKTNGSASPFSFGASTPVVTPAATPAAANPFSFSKPAADAPTPKPSPFAFNAPTTAPSTSTFAGFGEPPAIEETDGDSGMEDHSPPSTAQPKAAASTAFTFGAPAAAPALNGFGGSSAPFGGFGMDKGSKPLLSTNSFGAPAAGTVSPFGGFGSASPSPAPQSPAPGGAFNFGAPATTSTTPAFSFGAPPAATNPFGGASLPPSGTASPVVAPFQFGVPVPSINVFGAGAPAASTPSFGAANPSPFVAPSPFGAPANSSTMFGGQSAAPPPTNSPFAFGTPTAAPVSTMFGAPSQSGTPSFGGFGSAPSTSAGAGFTFGAPSGAPAPVTNFMGGASAPGSPAVGGAMFNLGSGGDTSPNKSGVRRIAGMRRKK